MLIGSDVAVDIQLSLIMHAAVLEILLLTSSLYHSSEQHPAHI